MNMETEKRPKFKHKQGNKAIGVLMKRCRAHLGAVGEEWGDVGNAVAGSLELAKLPQRRQLADIRNIVVRHIKVRQTRRQSS